MKVDTLNFSAPHDWTALLFTSELGFLLHLPIWIQYPDEGEAHPPYQPLRFGVFAARLALHSLAVPLLLWDARDDLWSWRLWNSVFWGTYSAMGWSLMAVSAALYGLTYIHHRVHVALRSGKTSPNPYLYALGHVSIVNFLLDIPGKNVPSARVTHAIIVAINIVAASVLIFTLLTITPIQEAWGCYDPAFIGSARDFNRGVCPTDRDSNANICTERPYTNCETRFETDTFHKEVHYATQAVAIAAVVYTLSIGNRLTFFKLAAYT